MIFHSTKLFNEVDAVRIFCKAKEAEREGGQIGTRIQDHHTRHAEGQSLIRGSDAYLGVSLGSAPASVHCFSTFLPPYRSASLLGTYIIKGISLYCRPIFSKQVS